MSACQAPLQNFCSSFSDIKLVFPKRRSWAVPVKQKPSSVSFFTSLGLVKKLSAKTLYSYFSCSERHNRSATSPSPRLSGSCPGWYTSKSYKNPDIPALAQTLNPHFVDLFGKYCFIDNLPLNFIITSSTSLLYSSDVIFKKLDLNVPDKVEFSKVGLFCPRFHYRCPQNANLQQYLYQQSPWKEESQLFAQFL